MTGQAAPGAPPLVLALPGPGRWRVRNSPANRVPSHGTSLFALDHAIDLVPVDERGRSAPITAAALLRPQAPEDFPGFGRALLAPVRGIVHAVHDGEEDHPAHRGIPSLGYALTQGRRVAGGWAGLAGNHLILRTPGPGAQELFVALCHLRRGSLGVRPGQEVGIGDPVGECGNSGNSTEPHLHLQVMDAADPSRARPVPFAFPGGLPRNGAILDGGRTRAGRGDV